MSFFRVEDLEVAEVLPGVRLRSVGLENLMVTFVEYREGAEIPLHHHRYEQITYVLEGFVEVCVGKERRVLRPGEGVRIPAKMEHSSRPIEGPARALDAWTPVPKSLKLEDLVTLGHYVPIEGEQTR